MRADESQKRRPFGAQGLRQEAGSTIATVPKEDDERGVHVHPLSLTCLRARNRIRDDA